MKTFGLVTLTAVLALTACLSREYNSSTVKVRDEDKRPQDRVLTLMYHEIVGDNQLPSNISRSSGAKWKFETGDVSLKSFKDQMSFLEEKGYTSISVHELYDAMKGRADLPPKPVLLTFDDGYIGNFENALPVLRKHKLKATFFVVTGTVGVKAGGEMRCGGISSYDHMTWEQLKQIEADPLFEVEGHSHCHPLDPDGLDQISDKDLYTEVVTSKEFIKKNMGKDAFAFAYPQGRHGWREVELVRKHYKMAFAVSNIGEEIDEFYQIKRKDIGQRADRNFEAFINDVNRWLNTPH